MTVTLAAPTIRACELVREWRNAVPEGLRTPFMLTTEMQADFYQRVCCDRNSPHRYWSILTPMAGEPGRVVGMVGLTNISPENGHAEISLVTDPFWRGKGIGSQAVWLACEQAFDAMRLVTIVGEVYHCNNARAFWAKQTARLLGSTVVLPRRKWYAGQLWDADWFTWDVDGWRIARRKREAA